ncbi:hypothetical protein Gotur_032154, partial [Gossypium turneri]
MATKENDQIIKENKCDTKIVFLRQGVFLTSVVANLLCWEKFATQHYG